MRGRVPAIPGRKQDALFRSRLAKGAAVLSTDEPGKSRHSTTRRNPSERLAMFLHEAGKLPKILSCGLLRSPEHDVSMPRGNLCQHFSRSVV